MPVVDSDHSKDIVTKAENNEPVSNEDIQQASFGKDSEGHGVLRTEISNPEAIAGGSGGGLVTEEHDYIGLTYITSGNGAGEIGTVVYKNGGAAGTTVATLTLAYDATNNLTSVVKS